MKSDSPVETESSLKRTALLVVSTWFGCGLVPFAPGTVGTLGAIPLVWFVSGFGDFRYVLFSFGFIVTGIVLAQLYEAWLAERHDPAEFVLDEVAGFMVTMALVPITWMNLLAGFFLFRLFDILKPFPISWIDRRVPGGFGAMADDLVAGLFANLVLHFLLRNFWAVA